MNNIQKNPFEYLSLPPRPDFGNEPRDFSTVTLHRYGEESIQLRVRQHHDGYSTGWHVIMPNGERNIFPTPENGLFKDERDAHLFALGEILVDQVVTLSLPAKQAVQQAIAQWRQFPLF